MRAPENECISDMAEWLERSKLCPMVVVLQPPRPLQHYYTQRQQSSLDFGLRHGLALQGD